MPALAVGRYIGNPRGYKERECNSDGCPPFAGEWTWLILIPKVCFRYNAFLTCLQENLTDDKEKPFFVLAPPWGREGYAIIELERPGTRSVLLRKTDGLCARYTQADFLVPINTNFLSYDPRSEQVCTRCCHVLMHAALPIWIRSCEYISKGGRQAVSEGPSSGILSLLICSLSPDFGYSMLKKSNAM